MKSHSKASKSSRSDPLGKDFGLKTSDFQDLASRSLKSEVRCLKSFFPLKVESLTPEVLFPEVFPLEVLSPMSEVLSPVNSSKGTAP